jgi:hypothetical protein
LFFDVDYQPTFVQLIVVNQVPGDYNLNGVVDAPDYVLWRDTLGLAVTAFSGADGDGDGTIDDDDYGVWRAHFGQTVAGSGSGQVLSVPEPSVVLTALAGMLVVAGHLPRRLCKRVKN